MNDVKIGAVDASVFAYVADGRNGLRILQVISPEDSSESYGFSPRPTPKLIATYRTAGRRWRFRAESTATAPSMKAAINSPSSDAAARAPSTAPKQRSYIFATASSTPLRTPLRGRRDPDISCLFDPRIV